MKNYHKFATPEEVKNWVEKNYTQRELEELDNLYHSESALGYYKGGSSRQINMCVSLGYQKYYDLDLDEMQQYLLSKTIEDAIEVYRFVEFRELSILILGTLRGRVFECPIFLSTTLLHQYYSMDEKKRGRILITFKLPKGTKGTYLPEVNPVQPEFEVLLPHHVRIRKINLRTYEVIGCCSVSVR